MKRIMNISMTMLLAAGAIVLAAFAGQNHQHAAYKSFTIDVLNPTDDALITTEEIGQMIRDRFGEVTGQAKTRIDLNKLETMVRDNPYVSSCEVYQTLGHELILKARVRRPLVRVINEDLEQYLIDHQGYIVPVNPAHPSYVLIANGRITDAYFSPGKQEIALSQFPDSSALRQVYPVALHIAEDEFLRAFIHQVYVNDNGEMELIQRIGGQVILFGDASRAAEKLENLKAFYKEVMSKADWNRYQTINLKYKNQVVCLKTETNE